MESAGSGAGEDAKRGNNHRMAIRESQKDGESLGRVAESRVYKTDSQEMAEKDKVSGLGVGKEPREPI